MALQDTAAFEACYLELLSASYAFGDHRSEARDASTIESAASRSRIAIGGHFRRAAPSADR